MPLDWGKEKTVMVKPQRGGASITYLPTLFLLRSQCLHAEYKYNYIHIYILYTPRVYARVKYVSYVMHQLMPLSFFFFFFLEQLSCECFVPAFFFLPVVNVALGSVPPHHPLKGKIKLNLCEMEFSPLLLSCAPLLIS